MPSYRTHVSVNLLFALPVALAAMRYTVNASPKEMISFSVAFIYGTYFLHPDLDLANKIRLFSLKGLLTFPFRSYSRIFRHRGLSHVPILGTVTRIAWLMFFVWGICYLFGLAFPEVSKVDSTILIFGIIGLMIADLIHVALDHLN